LGGILEVGSEDDFSISTGAGWKFNPGLFLLEIKLDESWWFWRVGSN
jgi:hypothetical protein